MPPNSRKLEGSTSRSLIVRLQNNETPAWQELVELYSPLIVYWCRRMGVPRQECSDLAQEVFRSVVGNIESFNNRKDGGTFRGWLRTLTKNKAIDYYRRNENKVIAIGGSEARSRLKTIADADDLLVRDEDELRQEHKLFMRAISFIRQDFAEQTWKAFWLVAIDGLNATEAAQKLDMSSAGVRVAKSRVLKRLRAQLGDREPSDQ